MNDIENAKSKLQKSDFTCVLCKGDKIYTSTVNGISPMVEFISDGTDIKEFSVADKIVGKAAAMLFALAGIKEVYAGVMSETALSVFSKYSIHSSYGILVKSIINRSGNGPCPMENAVKDIDSPLEAFEAIKCTISILKNENKEKID